MIIRVFSTTYNQLSFGLYEVDFEFIVFVGKHYKEFALSLVYITCKVLYQRFFFFFFPLCFHNTLNLSCL